MIVARMRPTLHVEGKNDRHTVIHLMRHFGIDYDTRPWPAEYPEIKEAGSVENLLDGIEVAVKAATDTVTGFVFDADSPLASRWESIKTRLRNVDVVCPNMIPAEGLICESPRFKARVGVWIMPDNVNDGKLETFLSELIREADLLITHAQQSTNEALSKGAKFSPPDLPKATLHAWLAWQENPGLPYGSAMRARYFTADRPAGVQFAQWFNALYQI